MAGRKSYGRAYPIKNKDVRSYTMTERPRRARPNPMGVTTLATVNGRTARNAAAGRSRASTVQRARGLLSKNAKAKPYRASFIKKLRSNAAAKPTSRRRAGARLAAYQSARRNGKSEPQAAKVAVRNVPFTTSERRAGQSFKGVRGRKPTSSTATPNRRARKPGASKVKTATSNRRKTRRRSAAKKRTSSGRRTASRRKTTTSNRRRTTANKRKRTTKRATTRKRTAAKRRTTANKRRRTTKRTTKRNARRRTAANRRRSTTTRRRATANKSTKRSKAAKKGWATRRRRTTAKKNAPKRRKARRNAWYGQPRAHSRAAKKGWETRRKRCVKDRMRKRRAGGKKTAKRTRKAASRRKSTSRRRVRANSRRRYTPNKRRRSTKRRARPNRSTRRVRKNQFMSELMALMQTGSQVLGGFVLHKVLTAVASDALMPAPTGQMVTWRKPVVGFGVAALGMGLVNFALQGAQRNTRVAVSAGMFTSFLQSTVIAALNAANQPQLTTYLEGYSSSRAYDLRGTRRRRRAMRGLGLERHARSIMPRYTPVSGMGQFRQAAAGTGEYFSPRQQMGEYFASNNLQGVGAYEEAGPLALQPARSAVGQREIDDGIRPDSNLDEWMTMAESAAGVSGSDQFRQAAAGTGQYRQAAAGLRGRGRRGMGEFYAAQPDNGGAEEYRVPTASQWIPNGPLWAGTISAGDTPTESELPAGVLQGPGGNGILSG